MSLSRRVVRRGRQALMHGVLLVLLIGAPACAVDRDGPRDIPWDAHLRRVDDALTERNVSAAEWAWHQAYSAALRSRSWKGLVEVGDAYLRIGDAAHGRQAARATARRLYLAALTLARGQNSLEGVLRAAAAFAALGDAEVVQQATRMAEQIADRSGNPHARDRVNAFRARQATRSSAAAGANLDPFPLLFPDEMAGP